MSKKDHQKSLAKTPSPERAALAEAIAAFQTACAKVAGAERTLQKANDLYASLQADLAALAGLDEEIAAAKASNLAMALANDEQPMFEEPGGFSTAVLKKQRLESELATLGSSIGVLEAEPEAAREHADDCDLARELAAEKVLVAETSEMAANHLAKLTELRKEHYILGFLAVRYVRRAKTERTIATVPGHLYGSGPTRKVEMPGVVIGAAMENILGAYEAAGGLRVKDAVADNVARYWQALKFDASATLDVAKAGELPSPIDASPFWMHADGDETL